MKALLSHRKSLVALFIVVLAILLVSCAPNASEPIISSQLGTVLAAREAGQEVSAMPTATPVLLTALSAEQIYAGLPADLRAAIDTADPARAQQIALANGCLGCHSLDPNQTMTGPTWYHLGDTAAMRVPNESPAEYLHQSIVAPGAYVVPNFPNGVMPQDFGSRLSTQELADLIAFLLEQHQ
ncbi:MAG TPA: c-type cytochrome [Caldilineaceae bacterium]|nr:c-type cytochrome [Caldilineaceae bacterium]